MLRVTEVILALFWKDDYTPQDVEKWALANCSWFEVIDILNPFKPMTSLHLTYNCANVVEWEHLTDYYYSVISLSGPNGCISRVMLEIKIYPGRVDDTRSAIF
uniref:Uncharacterized protein n=1 Tax=Physcomitrium patens TaxID=3218 RepID=A0A7I4F3T8_PHYPA